MAKKKVTRESLIFIVWITIAISVTLILFDQREIKRTQKILLRSEIEQIKEYTKVLEFMIKLKKESETKNDYVE